MEREEPLSGALRGVVGVVVVWAVLSGVWSVHAIEYADSTVGEAVWSGVISMGSATLLSLGVWVLTGVLRWPEPVTFGFLGVHVFLGAVYSASWILVGHVVSVIAQGRGTVSELIEANVLGWRFSMGLLLYGVAAGVSYTVRTRRSLSEQELRATEAEALAAESRLDAIRAQMDPHFLFNALHSVSSLIDDDPEAAQIAIEGLGELLRYSLDDDSGEVLLAQEWSLTQNYLEIEALRLGDRLVVEADIDDAATSRVVPSFCLQTLVENAIRHGVSRSATPQTRLRVRVGEEGGMLLIHVADEGPGAEEDAVVHSGGRGLRSIRERIRTLYGSDAHLDVETAPGEGFSAKLWLPNDAPGSRGPEPALGDRSHVG